MLLELWDSLPKCPQHPITRRVTPWGTKTLMGLFFTMERLVEESKGAGLKGVRG